jgi:hypothetical protein
MFYSTLLVINLTMIMGAHMQNFKKGPIFVFLIQSYNYQNGNTILC